MGFFDFLSDVFDGLSDIAETATDGFNEMVIKGNSDYKSSYDLRNEAESIISSATENINNWKSIASEKSAELKNQLQNENAFRKSIFEKSTCYKNISQSELHFKNISSPENLVLIPGQLFTFIRKEEAKQFYNEAKSYQTEASLYVSVLQNYIAKIECVFQLIAEERRILQKLVSLIGTNKNDLEIISAIQHLVAEIMINSDLHVTKEYERAIQFARGFLV